MMRRSKLLALGVVLLGSACFGIILSGCGSSGNTHGESQSTTTPQTSAVPTATSEEQKETPIIEPSNTEQPIRVSATGVDWEALAGAHRTEVAEAFLHSSMGKIGITQPISARALVSAAERFIEKGNINKSLVIIMEKAVEEIESQRTAREVSSKEQQEAHLRELL